MPGGRKSILIIKTLYISYITKLFGLRVLFFEGGKKKRKKLEGGG